MKRSAATFCIYRNLHKPNHFSVMLRNKVVDHKTTMLLEDCRFVVSEKRRCQVVEQQRKLVHAFVRASNYKAVDENVLVDEVELYYDPYFTNGFISVLDGRAVIKAKRVLCQNNKCYAIEPTYKGELPIITAVKPAKTEIKNV